MTAERSIATLVSETGYSTSTVRKWWKHKTVRPRTRNDIQRAAKRLKIRRPRQ